MGTSPYKDELQLCKVSQSGDLIQIVVVVVKHTSSFGLFAKVSHLEGEEVFG
jgi:hypothetical protein